MKSQRTCNSTQELLNGLEDYAKTISLQAKLLCQAIDTRQQRIETSELADVDDEKGEAFIEHESEKD